MIHEWDFDDEKKKAIVPLLEEIKVNSFEDMIYGIFGGSPVWLFGAFPAAYGLIGSFTYVLWRQYEAMGQSQIMAFRLIGLLLAIILTIMCFLIVTTIILLLLLYLGTSILFG